MKELKSTPNGWTIGAAAGGVYRFGPFRLDARKYRLWRDDEIVSLTRKASHTLVALVSHAGDIVDKEDLLREVWPDTFVNEDTLTQNISTLRKALGDDAEIPEYIETVPRRGYRFLAPVVEEPATGEMVPPDGAPATRGTGAATGGPAPRTRERLWMAIAVTATAVALALGVTLLLPADPAPVGLPFRFNVRPPRGTALASAGAVSPDGHFIAFAARDGSGRTLLALRAVDALDPITLADTDGASHPFWSPDSRSIGYFAEGELRTIGVGGGPTTTLAQTGASPQGGTWNRAGVIVFSPGSFSALRRVSALGGAVEDATSLSQDARETGHWWPQFLPDGEHFLFSVASAESGRAGLYVGSLSGGEPQRVLDVSAAGAVYAWPGYLLFTRNRTLMAQPFDASSLRLSGTPMPVAADVSPPDLLSGPQVSASATGLLGLASGRTGSRLTWYDRAGRLLGSGRALVDLRNPALSADERSVVAERMEAGRSHLWLLDLDRGVTSRITEGDASGQSAVWAPDGQSIAYSSVRRGSLDLYLRSMVTGKDEDVLVGAAQAERAFDWSPDGRYLVYGTTASSGRSDLWLLPMTGERRPVAYLDGTFNEMQAAVSPDSRWLAYTSDESGEWDVYVQSFPEPGRKLRVSVAGGAQPRWRSDGGELFFLAPDGRVMAAPVADRATMRLGVPVPLFQVELPGALDSYRNYYVVTSDGARFLIDSVIQGSAAIEAVQNWRAILRR